MEWSNLGCCVTSIEDFYSQLGGVTGISQAVFTAVRNFCDLEDSPACPIKGQPTTYLKGFMYFGNLNCSWYNGLTPLQEYHVRVRLCFSGECESFSNWMFAICAPTTIAKSACSVP